MEAFNDLLRQGVAQAWFFLPTAVLLGALHGLEPGHSKSLMAAFIIAVRGTVPQAILLGISAAFSHVLVVWVLALAALTWGESILGERMEAQMMFASGVIVLIMAWWMFQRAQRDLGGHGHGHHGHDHDHDHEHGHDHGAHDHGDDHGHDHGAHDGEMDEDFMDAHGRAHAMEIQSRFTNRKPSTGEIVIFGLTGGLMPCTAAVTVLLVCLQIKEFLLGVAMVGAFSLGLALSLVGVGVAAAWGAQQASRRFSGFDRLSRRLPVFSSLLVGLIGAVMTWTGMQGMG